MSRAPGAFPAGVARVDRALEAAVDDHLFGQQQRAGADVHAADVPVQQVDRVDRLAPHLRVEVHAAAAQAAGLQHV